MFEYTTAVANGPVQDSDMNKLGEDGWELVSLVTFPTRVNTISFCYVFKRFKTTPLPSVPSALGEPR